MLNYRHLYYFWMVAKEGGLAQCRRTARHGHSNHQRASAGLRKSLGCQLLKPAGRTVVLTEAGEQVFARAEAIFQLGQRLEEDISQQDNCGCQRALAQKDGRKNGYPQGSEILQKLFSRAAADKTAIARRAENAKPH